MSAQLGPPPEDSNWEEDAGQGVNEYISVIEQSAMNSVKTALLTAMLHVETRPHVIEVFSSIAGWRGQGAEGRFHGPPDDWGLVVSALQIARKSDE